MTNLEQTKVDIRAALAALSQNKTYPGDIVNAKHHLTNALSGLLREQQAHYSADAAYPTECRKCGASCQCEIAWNE